MSKENGVPLEALKAALPHYARDTKLNLGSVLDASELSTQQVWGTALAVAFASRCGQVLQEIAKEARASLTDEAMTAAKAAASIMAMNNVYYRSKYLLSDPEYGYLTPRLRMQIIGNNGVEKTDFTLWCLAVSSITGCAPCLDSHEKELRQLGVTREAIHEALRIAAVVNAVSVTLESEQMLLDVEPTPTLETPIPRAPTPEASAEPPTTASAPEELWPTSGPVETNTPIYAAVRPQFTTDQPPFAADHAVASSESSGQSAENETEEHSWWSTTEYDNVSRPLSPFPRTAPDSPLGARPYVARLDITNFASQEISREGRQDHDPHAGVQKNDGSEDYSSGGRGRSSESTWAVRTERWMGIGKRKEGPRH